MTSFSLTNPSNPPNLSPNIALGGFRGTRYPNQFFDLSQQYMPPTIKELFRWCTFYYYNSPLIGAAIKKVSRYPITDLVFEDEHESTRDLWSTVFNDYIKMKDRLMEVNLDYHVYGNSFVSLHLPFTRFLICKNCKHRQPIKQWNWSFRSSVHTFSGTCSSCSHTGDVDVKDVPYRDLKAVKLIRWNPENMQIKYNEYTGRYVYMYMVPAKLKNAILRGDKDILEDIPLVVLEAIRKRRLIRFNEDNLIHLKNPTLAEQDQGWGKPAIIHVLKDMFYFYTLRRAQEAIALEHIVPFDLIYPLPNAQQDPYIHTDLAGWRTQIESVIEKHRRDPNFKAVIPIPVGFGRLGGDGKALLLSPELNYLTQTVVGGMGIPSEMLMGGMNWTGSSVTLRMLENDFIQNRSQLLDLVYWVKKKLRIWMTLPDCKKMKFADFRMADDIQKNQQLIGLNAQGKVSDQTLLTELGYDYDQEVKKMLEEIYVKNYMMDLQSKGSAKSQGESQLIQFNYQQKLQELANKAQEEAKKKIQDVGEMAQLGDGEQQQMMLDRALPEQGAGYPQEAQTSPQEAQPSGGMEGTSEMQPQVAAPQNPQELIDTKVSTWARQLAGIDPAKARMTIAEIKMKMPDIGSALEKAYGSLVGQGMNPQAGGQEVSMAPLPEQKVPRRQGAV